MLVFMNYCLFGLCAILLIGFGLATDVPFVFSDNLTSIADYTSDEVKAISESSPDLVGVPKDSSPDKWDLQKETQFLMLK
jgi:hypothetical protein